MTQILGLSLPELNTPLHHSLEKDLLSLGVDSVLSQQSLGLSFWKGVWPFSVLKWLAFCRSTVVVAGACPGLPSMGGIGRCSLGS